MQNPWMLVLGILVAMISGAIAGTITKRWMKR